MTTFTDQWWKIKLCVEWKGTILVKKKIFLLSLAEVRKILAKKASFKHLCILKIFDKLEGETVNIKDIITNTTFTFC
jgi:hypothetical protein